MGAVDLVIQVESPGAVSRGPAAHRPGRPPGGRAEPGQALPQAPRRPGRGGGRGRAHARRPDRAHPLPPQPARRAAQQIVAMVALDDWVVADLAALLRGARHFAELTDEVLHDVLDLLAGRYPSDEFAELRPRIVWDRVADVIGPGPAPSGWRSPAAAPSPTAACSACSCPTAPGSASSTRRWSTRAGPARRSCSAPPPGASRTSPTSGSSSPRRPASPGKMPFWHGDGPGRPLELGRALGAFVRELRGQLPEAERALAWPRDRNDLDALGGRQPARATSTSRPRPPASVPDDRTIVVERFRDEIGDWRVCVLSPFGAQVHAPWAMALRHRLRRARGASTSSSCGATTASSCACPRRSTSCRIDELLHRPRRDRRARRRRSCPARALFASPLPRVRGPGPAAAPPPARPAHAAVAAAPAGRRPAGRGRQATRRSRSCSRPPASASTTCSTCPRCARCSPTCAPAACGWSRSTRRGRRRSPQSLLFGWIAVYMYEGDAPLAERRAAALALDRDLLRELLGAEELRELLDPDGARRPRARAAAPGRRPPGPRRRRAPRPAAPSSARSTGAELGRRAGRATRRRPWTSSTLAGRSAASSRWPSPARTGSPPPRTPAACATRSASRCPLGLPAAFTDSGRRARWSTSSARYARTHGPFLDRRGGRPLRRRRRAASGPCSTRSRPTGRLVRGEFRPDGVEREWCDADVLRQLRRRSLAALRREVEPVEARRARPLPARVAGRRRRRGAGIDGLVEALGVLQGAAIPASVLEADVLAGPRAPTTARPTSTRCAPPARSCGSAPAPSAPTDGRVRLVFRDQAALLLAPAPGRTDARARAARPPDRAAALLAHLGQRGASFWPDLVAGGRPTGTCPTTTPTVLAALWDLVWAGEVTNDSLAPAAGLRGGGPGRRSQRRRPRRPLGPSGRRAGRLGRLAGATRASAPCRAAQPLGPPAGPAAGRWSPRCCSPRRRATEVAHARALQLLERYGVLTREAALGEGIEGGFAGVYPVLKALEERGPGAARLLRGRARRRPVRPARRGRPPPLPARERRSRTDAARPARTGGAAPSATTLVVLAATDPAQPYGAALPVAAHRRAARPAPPGALRGAGRRRGRRPTSSGRPQPAHLPRAPSSTPGWAGGAAPLVDPHAACASSSSAKIDGAPARRVAAVADALRAAGFADGYRGPVLRR